MTIHDILNDTKSLIPFADDRSVICTLKTGKKVVVNVAEHLDFQEEYESMRDKILGSKKKVEKTNVSDKMTLKGRLIVRRETDGKIFTSAKELCKEIGTFANYSWRVLNTIAESGMWKGVPYTILKRETREKTSYSVEVLKKLAFELENGKTVKEIAAEFGITTAAIHKAKSKYLSHINLNSKRIVYDKKKVIEIRRLLESGMQNKDIAEKLGISREAFYQVKSKYLPEFVRRYNV